MADELRIRLEGRLEVIESATQSLEELEKLLRAGKWPDTRAARHLQIWESLQPRLPDALEAAQRADGSVVVARLTKAKQSLDGFLQKRFSASSIGRARDLTERLALWHQLVASTGLPVRGGQPITEVTVKRRTWWWLGIALLGFPMLAVGQYGASIALIFAAAFTRELVPSVVRYRLFADVLERTKDGEPTLQLPLTSFEGNTLRGLVDLEMEEDERFAGLRARMNQLANEREVLRLEARSLERFQGPAGRWLMASFSSDLTGQPETVEVISFAKATRGSPIEMKARRGAVPPPRMGLALLCERGLLFIPQSAEQAVRAVLFETERVELMHEQQRLLSTFPSELILDHLEELRRIVGVQWCAAEDSLKWKPVAQREELELDAGRLSVSVDESARYALRRLWPP
jgi:hypothetical protein